ncbi:MAG: hypothetical protein ACLU8W_05870 [Clostridia bacterium]
MHMHLSEQEHTIKMSVGEGGGIIDLPYYEGNCDITPKVIPQKMETKNKAMREDVLIRQIPYEAVSNGSGTTVTIGGY